MQNKQKFIEILEKCKGTLSLNEFSKKVDVDSGYLSRIINNNSRNYPSVNILRRIADNSKGITTYEELMRVCGYIDINRTDMEDQAIKSLEDMVERQIPGYSLIDIVLKYIKRIEGRS